MTAKTAIFVGPTLPAEQVKEILPDAWILPPAEQGDVEYAHRMGCEVLGLIDGVHTKRLPVWHKEILTCLSGGSRLVGAASMGALRAVECHPWGAEPVGEIASWYRDGMIDADDEVCVSHLGKAQGYRTMSLPLVNIRASLRAAQVGSVRQAEIITAAQGIFYADRTWKAVFDAAKCLLPEQQQILACELDIKAADAMHLCYHIASTAENEIRSDSKPVLNADKGYGGVFLRNDRKIFTGKKVVRQHQLALPSSRDAALNRALALEYCKMVGIWEEAPEIDQIDQDISREDFRRLRNEEATLARARDWISNAASSFMDVPLTLDFMRVIGAYRAAKERA